MNIINEYLEKADRSIEIVELKQGNLWVYIKDSEAIIFESMVDFVAYIYQGKVVNRKYCNEDELMTVYENSTNFNNIALELCK